MEQVITARSDNVNGKTPHIVQYQGSKRILAPQILRYMPRSFNRLVEPFSGMAAISIAVAYEKRAHRYHINDINEPLVKLLQCAVENPSALVEKYQTVWEDQFCHRDGHIEHFKESLINDSLKRTIMFRQQETLVADSLSISIA